MPDSGAARAPWRAEQQISMITGLGFSTLLLLAGYIGVSGQARLTDQYPWITLAVLGLACSGIVHARWLLAGLVAVRTLQREVLPKVPTPQGAAPVGRTPAVSAVAPASRDSWVTVDGASTYVHRPGCVMVAGKPTAPASAAGGRVRCRLCTERAC